MDAILWLLRTGCQWRNLPPCWPHWQAVYYYFDQWKRTDLFERINADLNRLDRQQAGPMSLPSALCMDTQSIKLAPMVCQFRGNDAHKLVDGRKRTFVVDTQGRLWVADVDAAKGLWNLSRAVSEGHLMAGWRTTGKNLRRSGLQWGFRH